LIYSEEGVELFLLTLLDNRFRYAVEVRHYSWLDWLTQSY
jgi:hypothetical protein